MTRIKSTTETHVEHDGRHLRRTTSICRATQEDDVFWHEHMGGEFWHPLGGDEAAEMERLYLDTTVPKNPKVYAASLVG